MKIDATVLEQITFGAVRLNETSDGVTFDRFTAEGKAHYKAHRNKTFYAKSLCPAGVTLRFRTDSKTLGLSVKTEEGTSRFFFSTDVLVNGKYLDSIKNFEDTQMPPVYSKIEAPLGDFAKTFALGEGEKDVCIHLPWSVRCTLREMTLDDGASVLPLPYGRRALVFGDSITQGYDAKYTFRRYAGHLCASLDAEEHNLAIGGEKFCPDLAACDLPFRPDLITVAYGTNDWTVNDPERLYKNAKAFFEVLAAKYPGVPLFAITPLWRADGGTDRTIPFPAVADYIAECVKDNPAARVIRGGKILPPDTSLYADGRLHPNDDGFDRYYNYLKKEIR